jgi:hypothetical protein
MAYLNLRRIRLEVIVVVMCGEELNGARLKYSS